MRIKSVLQEKASLHRTTPVPKLLHYTVSNCAHGSSVNCLCQSMHAGFSVHSLHICIQGSLCTSYTWDAGISVHDFTHMHTGLSVCGLHTGCRNLYAQLTYMHTGLSMCSLHMTCKVSGWLRPGFWLEPRTLRETGSPYFSPFVICFFVVLGMEPWPSSMLGQYST